MHVHHHQGKHFNPFAKSVLIIDNEVDSVVLIVKICPCIRSLADGVTGANSNRWTIHAAYQSRI